MASANRAGVCFDMGDHLVGGDGRSAVVAVGQFPERREGRSADGHERGASALADGVVAIGHLFAEDFDPGVDRLVRLLRRLLFRVRFIGCIARAGLRLLLVLAGGLGGRRTKDE